MVKIELVRMQTDESYGAGDGAKLDTEANPLNVALYPSSPLPGEDRTRKSRQAYKFFIEHGGNGGHRR